ncbi:hypothetical protein HZB78_00125 [Candidatus Collierbacteria bacterium]|nr:hypothetical protein [Candidatus Collierbacteria bacterium]
MQIVDKKIKLVKLKRIAIGQFGNLVKAVVDIEKRVMAIGGELHADEEALLLQNGSSQEELWGINIYPDEAGKNQIEFDSMINLRPGQSNLSRGVDDPVVRKKIIEIVNKLIEK